jgi:hypothetical protein
MGSIGLLIPPERSVLVLGSLFTGDVTAQVTNQGYPQVQFLPRMLR